MIKAKYTRVVWTAAPGPTPEQAATGATPYGSMLDYLYAAYDNGGTMGSNIARRACWTDGEYIYAREFTEDEIKDQVPLAHGIFFVLDREIEYDSPAVDMRANDWEIGTRI